MRPMYVKNTIVTQEYNQIIVVFENEGRQTAVRMSPGRAALLIGEIKDKLPDRIKDES